MRRVSKKEKIERFTLRSQFERLSPRTRLRGRQIMRKSWWNNCPNLLQTFVIVSNFRDFRLSETSWRRDTVGDTIGILFVKKV